MNESLLDFFAVFWNQLLSHSVERCISSPFLFSSPLLDIPLSLETGIPPPPPLTPIMGKCQILLCHTGIWETEKNQYKAMETYYLKKLCVLSTECVLIDIIVTISITVGTGYNFPHGEVDTKSHHIKTSQ